MSGPLIPKRALIVVRTYPTPARRGVEVSCTAAITQDGDWMRLFPVPYRRLPNNQRFHKYQWVDLNVTKASDPRPESYTPDLDSIKVDGRIGTKNNWEARKRLLLPLASHCLCCLEKQRKERGHPTLGLFRPRLIKRLIVEDDDPEWTTEQLARLNQASFFDEAPRQELEKVPFRFKYEFQCDHDECPTHKYSCTDWEMIQSCRKWRTEYGDGWVEKFRLKYEHEMIHLDETSFYVGTLHGHPGTWIIVGLFYPRLSSPQGALL